ncbi:MAG TPA: nuclear transport factor 2 family protein, partial [Allosphingosinicella sp.]
MLLTLLAALAVAVQAAPPDPAPAIPTGDTLRAEIAARDADLFETLFNRCDEARMRSLIAEDIEFYHDRDGATRGADAFVADYVRWCTERQAP